MKVTVLKKGGKDFKFPKLMISKEKGYVVLFSRESVGVVISNGGAHKKGYHSSDFAMSCFEDFKGKVILENE